MNLIERLGGYDAAKEYLKKNSHFINFEGLERFYDALLQYRREHNIFEVGDKVVEASYLDDTSNEIGIYDGKSFHGYTCVKFSETLVMADESDFRHATDAEIEAGRRL